MRNNNSEDQKSRSKKKNKKILDETSKSLPTKNNVINITQQGIKLLKNEKNINENKPIYKGKNNIDKNIIITNSFTPINK